MFHSLPQLMWYLTIHPPTSRPSVLVGTPPLVHPLRDSTFSLAHRPMSSSDAILKTLRRSSKEKAQRGQYLLAVGLGRHIYKQLQILPPSLHYLPISQSFWKSILMPFKRHLAQPEDMITLLGSSPHWSPLNKEKDVLRNCFIKAFLWLIWLKLSYGIVYLKTNPPFSWFL